MERGITDESGLVTPFTLRPVYLLCSATSRFHAFSFVANGCRAVPSARSQYKGVGLQPTAAVYTVHDGQNIEQNMQTCV